MNSQDADVADRRKSDQDIVEPSRGECQRIAAGQNHFPHARVRSHVVDRAVKRRTLQRFPAAAYHLAAKAESTIYGARMRDLQQYAVGVAVHDTLDGAEGNIADGISALMRQRVQLSIIR